MGSSPTRIIGCKIRYHRYRPRLDFLSVRRKRVNQLHTYLESGTYVGLDRILILQRKIDGAIAAKLGLTALAPMGALVGLIIGYVVFA